MNAIRFSSSSGPCSKVPTATQSYRLGYSCKHFQAFLSTLACKESKYMSLHLMNFFNPEVPWFYPHDMVYLWS